MDCPSVPAMPPLAVPSMNVLDAIGQETYFTSQSKARQWANNRHGIPGFYRVSHHLVQDSLSSTM